MGKRGPKKTPAPIKKQRGTYRPDRDQGIVLPDAISVPECPDFLDDRAKELWKKLGPSLVEAKLLTESDVMSFALLCQAWSDWQEAIAHIQHSGIVACGDKGNEYQAPAVGVRNKAWSMVLKGCQEFGLTPSSRTGPILPTSSPEDEETAETRAILGM